MLLDGSHEHPLVRYYRIEFANECHNSPVAAHNLTADLVRQRLGLEPDLGIMQRLFRKIKNLLS